MIYSIIFKCIIILNILRRRKCKSMKILAIDSSTEACSTAVWKDGIIYSNFKLCAQEHSNYILPLLKNVLYQSNTKLREFNALAFTRGPGSFTGVRIGMSLAKGISLGMNCPMIGISTLLTMAQNVRRVTGLTQVLVAIDARMREIYWAEYIYCNSQNIWYGQESEALLTPEKINKRLKVLSGEWITVGTGWKIWPEIADGCKASLTQSNILFPSAEGMFPIACQFFIENNTVLPETAQPMYLRNKVTKNLV